MSNSVPKDWQVSKIGELIQKVIDNRGKTPPLSDKGKELIEINCVESYKFPNYDLIKKYVSNKTYNSWFRGGHPKKGDILVSTVGSIGQFSIMSDNRGCIAQNIIAIRPKKNICNDYLYYACSGDTIKKRISSVLMGAVQPSLKVPDFLAINLHLPTLPEQKKIASILTSVDEVIEKTQSKINKFQDIKKSVMNNLLTKGIGHTEFKDCTIGKIPIHWKVKSLSEICKISSGGTPSTSKKEYWKNGNIPWLSSGEVNKKRIYFSDNKITQSGLKNSAAKLFPPKTVLIALAGQGKTRGIVAITEIEASTNQSIAGFICNKNICLPDYLFFNLDTRYVELRTISGGSGRAGLNLSILSKIMIALPKIEEQKKISNIIFSLEDKILITKKKLNKYIFFKKSLMQDLLTGKVRVSVN